MRNFFKDASWAQFLIDLWRTKSKPTYGRISHRRDVIIGCLIIASGWFAYDGYNIRSAHSDAVYAIQSKFNKAEVELDSLKRELQTLQGLGQENLDLLAEATNRADDMELELEKSKLREAQLVNDNEALKASIVSTSNRAEAAEKRVGILEEILENREQSRERVRLELTDRLNRLSSNH